MPLVWGQRTLRKRWMSLGKGPGKALDPQGTRGPGPQEEWDKTSVLGLPGATATGPHGEGAGGAGALRPTVLGTPRSELGQPGDR